MVNEQQSLSRLNKRLRVCFSEDDNLRDLLDEPYFWSGQGFRGMLCLEVGASLDIDPKIATEVALFTELLHNASLIHDDIIDRDEQRRGHPTIWKKYGSPKAILIGDLLIAKAFEIALSSQIDSKIKVKWSSFLSQTVLHAVKGAISELDFDLFSESNVFNRYYDMATLKTGSLFALPVGCLASVASMNPKDTLTLTDSFSDLAVAYQIRDDQADFYGNKHGRNITSDISNGRPNLYHLLSTNTSQFPDFEQDIASYHSRLVSNATDSLTTFDKSLREFVDQRVLPFIQLDSSLALKPSLRATV